MRGRGTTMSHGMQLWGWTPKECTSSYIEALETIISRETGIQPTGTDALDIGRAPDLGSISNQDSGATTSNAKATPSIFP
mmetsp:Transcript_107222/g.160359  ORF Transcript_107222/g.160359 Transcript_107222/m.160359 type:complete len:80 (+) Transcript_107222:278-517(+)